jgi:hypothetical protein
MANYLNINWLLSRLLEKLGIKTYLERVEFTAHFFAGCTFGLLGFFVWWIPLAWILITLVDEFIFDKWKGKDTVIDLISKLSPVVICLLI